MVKEKKSLKAPALTPTQRALALKKAALVRSRRSAIRAQLAKGKLSFRELLEKTDDPIVGRMMVYHALVSVPGIGSAKANKIMKEVRISPSRRLRGLGARQCRELLEIMK